MSKREVTSPGAGDLTCMSVRRGLLSGNTDHLPKKDKPFWGMIVPFSNRSFCVNSWHEQKVSWSSPALPTAVASQQWLSEPGAEGTSKPRSSGSSPL